MMFTKTQGQELIDNTISTWTTINGKNGRKFINKTDTSKYIFLPTGGVLLGDSQGGRESSGWYWSTIIRTDLIAHAWYIRSEAIDLLTAVDVRYYGISIRAVRPLEW